MPVQLMFSGSRLMQNKTLFIRHIAMEVHVHY